jgi:hypothetical protein
MVNYLISEKKYRMLDRTISTIFVLISVLVVLLIRARVKKLREIDIQAALDEARNNMYERTIASKLARKKENVLKSRKLHEQLRSQALEERRMLNVIQKKTGLSEKDLSKIGSTPNLKYKHLPKLSVEKIKNNIERELQGNKSSRLRMFKYDTNNGKFSRYYHDSIPAMTDLYSRRDKKLSGMYPEVYKSLGYIKE